MSNITQVTFYPNEIQYYGFNHSTQPSISGQDFTSSGGETTGALYDLLDNRRSARVQINTNGETVAADITIVPTANISSCNFAIIDNHNLKSADAKIYINDEYSASLVSIINSKSGTLGSAMSADSVTTGIITISANGTTLINIAATNFTTNGWTLDIDDVNIFDANVLLGEFAAGKSFTPSVNPEYGEAFEFGYANDGLSLYTNKSGRRFVSHFHSERRFWKLDFNCVTESELAEFRRIFQITRGYPLYVSFDSDSNTPTVYRVRIVNSYNAIPIAAGLYEVVVEMEEEL